MPTVPPTARTPRSFARILDTVGVALTPGTDFSPSRGRDYLRIAYTQSESRLREAVARLRGLL